MPRFRVIAFVAAAALLTGAGVAEGVTRWSGTTLATVALGPAGDAWVGVVSNVAIPGRTPIVLDLVTDYTYSGDIDLELDADLVDEARTPLHLVVMGSDDDGGAQIAEHFQGDRATTRADGRWSGRVVLRTRGEVHLQSATATLRANPTDLEWLVALLALPGVLTLVVAFLVRRTPTIDAERARAHTTR